MKVIYKDLGEELTGIILKNDVVIKDIADKSENQEETPDAEK
ncbi:hypothetical protein [Crassaminicella profunda]|nr:hypothetical protein [Crassaminicella profunda]